MTGASFGLNMDRTLIPSVARGMMFVPIMRPIRSPRVVGEGTVNLGFFKESLVILEWNVTTWTRDQLLNIRILWQVCIELGDASHCGV